jgi:hypothetical protein
LEAPVRLPMMPAHDETPEALVVSAPSIQPCGMTMPVALSATTPSTSPMKLNR